MLYLKRETRHEHRAFNRQVLDHGAAALLEGQVTVSERGADPAGLVAETGGDLPRQILSRPHSTAPRSQVMRTPDGLMAMVSNQIAVRDLFKYSGASPSGELEVFALAELFGVTLSRCVDPQNFSWRACVHGEAIYLGSVRPPERTLDLKALMRY